MIFFLIFANLFNRKKVENGITIVGTGNVASWFCYILHQKNFCIKQIYGRNYQKAKHLADHFRAEAIDDVCRLTLDDNTLYLLALSDDSYVSLLERLPAQLPLAVHTAGSLSCHILQKYALHYGVVYPYQTISQNANFQSLIVPLCVEGSDDATEKLLLQWANHLSDNVSLQSESQRFALHIAAVFASNFTNAMCQIGYDILASHHIAWQVVLPIIQQTFAKIMQMLPQEAQTGPAKRGDYQIMQKHVQLLQDELLVDIYKSVSKYIINKHKTNNNAEL